MERPLLALETCGKSASVAIVWPNGLSDLMKTDPQVGSARSLAPAIAKLLTDHRLLPTDLAAIAVTIGPGSFTGLRVGVATAKSMAYALGIPTIPIDSLESLAWETVSSLYSPCDVYSEDDHVSRVPPMMIWTLMDAYRGELFVGLWKFERQDEQFIARAVVPSCLVNIDEWIDARLAEPWAAPRRDIDSHLSYQSVQEKDIVFAGPGLGRCRRLLESGLFDRLALRPEIVAGALSVGKLGRRQLLAGQTIDPFELMPVYLRRSAAEEKQRGNSGHGSL